MKKNITCLEIKKLFPQLIESIRGDENTFVTEVTSPENAHSRSLVFASQRAHLLTALEKKAAAIIVSPPLVETHNFKSHESAETTTLLFCKNVLLALSQITLHFFDNKRDRFNQKEPTSPLASIAPTVKIEERVIVAPFAVIGESVIVKEGAIIGAHSVIECGASIGSDSIIHPHVVVGSRCHVGSRCEIHSNTTIGSDGYSYAHDQQGHHYKIPQRGDVIIEDDVEIGACCAIDRAAFDSTIIRRGTKVDNLCHIAHNCTIGKNGLVTAGFFIAGSSHIGDNFMCGGCTTVTDHVSITDNVQLAGTSVVTKNIDKPGVYGGNPLQPIKEDLKTRATLRNLPEMRKEIHRLQQLVEKKEVKT